MAIPAATPTPTPTPLCSPWATASPYPTTIVRYGFVQADTDFYVFGGVDNGAKPTNAVNRYNIATGTWTSLSPMPFSGEAPTCALDSSTNIAYCADGLATEQLCILQHRNRHLDPAEPRTPNGRMTTALHRVLSMARCFSRVAPAARSASVWVYDVATDTWSAGTSAPTEFLLAGYQQVGQFLYVVGGFKPKLANE